MATQQLSDLEVGCIIVFSGVGILVIIVLITVFVCLRMRRNRSANVQKTDPRMPALQTPRVMGGQSMTPVIIVNVPNGNTDNNKRNNPAYKALDPETNLVVYRTDEVTLSFQQSDGPDKKIITKPVVSEDGDSGKGASPVRSPANLNSPGSSNSSPEMSYESFPPPPPPSTLPPPITPISDIDEVADSTSNHDIYAQVNKKSVKTNPDTSDDLVKNVWRPRSEKEIEIIEKQKF